MKAKIDRRWMWLAAVVLAVVALFGGVAVAHEGYGVGDGTGPVGVEPLDGTGEQHHGPPGAVVEAEVEVEASVPVTASTGDRDRDRIRERDEEQLQEHLQDRDQSCDQDRLQDQERLQDRDRLHA